MSDDGQRSTACPMASVPLQREEGRQPRARGFGAGAEGTMSWDSSTGIPGEQTELPDNIKDPSGVWGSGYVISPTSCHGSRIER